MNPLLKFMLKQLEDNAVIIEKATKSGNLMEGLNYDKKYYVGEAFDTLHHGIRAVKSVLEEIL